MFFRCCFTLLSRSAAAKQNRQAHVILKCKYCKLNWARDPCLCWRDTPLINMASILSLTDDSLHRIVSYIDDPSSFYSIALSCQRFFQITKNTRSVLHINLLRAKAEYFIKRYIVEIGRDYDRCCKLQGLLRDSARLTGAKGMLTYDKVIAVWQINGPVAAKLFTWIRSREYSVDEGEPRATSFTEHQSVTLQLPSCGKSMVIETSYFGDYGHNYDPDLSIHVTCEDLDVKSEGFARCCPEDYMYWAEEEVRGAAEPMKAAIELLQRELGETVPPITDHFFIWLCYLFPDQSNLLEENRLSFKDPARNTKPTPYSVQPAIDEFNKDQQIEANLQKLVTEWESNEVHKSSYSKIMAETIQLLAQRSETKVLERLQGDASRFYCIATDYDLVKLPKQLLCDLLLRTSLEASSYNPGSIANKYVESRVFYKSFGGKVMQVCGSMHGDGAGYPTWDELELEFTLPDGKVLKLAARDKPLEIENLGPVTELLQKGISQSMQGEDRIPKIGNLFTAVYFLHALEFAVASDTFLGSYDKLIPSESEEDSSTEESEESVEP